MYPTLTITYFLQMRAFRVFLGDREFLQRWQGPFVKDLGEQSETIHAEWVVTDH